MRGGWYYKKVGIFHISYKFPLKFKVKMQIWGN